MPRPAGVANGEGQGVLPPVKKWTHRHEMIVYYTVVHMMNQTQIAELVNLTPGRVCQILADPYAVQRIAEVKNQIRLNMLANVESRLTNLSDHALRNLEHTIERKDLDLVLHPAEKKHQDRLSLDVLSMTGLLGPAGGKDGEKNKDKAPNEVLMKRLLYAIEKSNEAEEIQRAEREGRVVEAEVEEVQEGSETEVEADILND